MAQPTTQPSISFSCKFTTCRRRSDNLRPFSAWSSYLTHARRFHLTTCSILTLSTAAQFGVFAAIYDARNKRLCDRCADVREKRQPFPTSALCRSSTPRVIPARSPIWKDDVNFPTLPRTARAHEAITRRALNPQPAPAPLIHPKLTTAELRLSRHRLPSSKAASTEVSPSFHYPNFQKRPRTSRPFWRSSSLPSGHVTCSPSYPVPFFPGRPSSYNAYSAMSTLRSPARLRKTSRSKCGQSHTNLTFARSCE